MAMPGVPGTELSDISDRVHDEVEENYIQRGAGLFSADERRYLVGMKDFSAVSDPHASSRKKKHQVREKIRSGLLDLHIASLVLETEEWEEIISDGVSGDVPTALAADDDLGMYLRAMSSLIATVGVAVDGVEDAETDMGQTVTDGLSEFLSLRGARRLNRYAPVEVQFTPAVREPVVDLDTGRGGLVVTEGGVTRWSNFADKLFYADFRAGNRSRKEILEELVSGF
jgi:hypothetical protein